MKQNMIQLEPKVSHEQTVKCLARAILNYLFLLRQKFSKKIPSEYLNSEILKLRFWQLSQPHFSQKALTQMKVSTKEHFIFLSS